MSDFQLRLICRVSETPDLLEKTQSFFSAFLSGPLASHEIPEESATLLTAELSTHAHRELLDQILAPTFASFHPDLQKNIIAISIREDAVVARPKKLWVFDMDSTLINEEVIVELAKEAGREDEVKTITHAAMSGELDFNQSLEKRVALLQGVSAQQVQATRDRLTLTAGAKELIQAIQSTGAKTALISGGFDFATRYFQDSLKLDYSFSHTLETHDGFLTGRVCDHPRIDAQGKQDQVLTLQRQLSITPEETVSVGDGANDLLMMAAASTSVSFLGKPALAQHCNTLVFDRDLSWLVSLMLQT